MNSIKSINLRYFPAIIFLLMAFLIQQSAFCVSERQPDHSENPLPYLKEIATLIPPEKITIKFQSSGYGISFIDEFNLKYITNPKIYRVLGSKTVDIHSPYTPRKNTVSITGEIPEELVVSIYQAILKAKWQSISAPEIKMDCCDRNISMEIVLADEKDRTLTLFPGSNRTEMNPWQLRFDLNPQYNYHPTEHYKTSTPDVSESVKALWDALNSLVKT